MGTRRELARRWFARFGPATVEDLQWWTGWTKTTVRHVVRALPVEDVDLHDHTGIALADDDLDDAATTPPVAALLPALEPTPMGWKQRDWFFGIPQYHVFDNRGNIGPTLWWDGEIIGSWAVAASGEVRTTIVADLRRRSTHRRRRYRRATAAKELGMPSFGYIPGRIALPTAGKN